MNIGDKVRVVHGKEEGVIVGFTSKGIVEVMLHDGFRIPFTKSDLVVVSVLEDKVFTPEIDSLGVPTKAVFADKGIFLAKTTENDGTHTFHLINNTDYQLLFTSFLFKPNQDTKTLAASTLLKKTSIQIFHTQQVSLLEESKIHVQMLFFATGRSDVKPPLLKEVDLKPKVWKGEQETLPVIGKKGYKIQLDIVMAQEELKAVGDALSDSTPKGSQKISLKPANELDLHIEKLVNDHYALKPDEMLRYQMRAFENHLEKAISAGLKEVTYIHGVGNGVLKNEIARKLSSNIFVKYYEDARKDKYGYGATKVTLK